MSAPQMELCALCGKEPIYCAGGNFCICKSGCHTPAGAKRGAYDVDHWNCLQRMIRAEALVLNLQERNKKLQFMVDNGLSEEEMVQGDDQPMPKLG